MLSLDMTEKLKEVREWAQETIKSKNAGPGGFLYCLKLNETIGQILESEESPCIPIDEVGSRPEEPREDAFRQVG